MYFIIGGDTKEYGPVTADDIRLWVAEGRLNTQSLVKNDGDTAWRTLASFPEFADLTTGTQQPASTAPLNQAAGASGDLNWQIEVTTRTPQLRMGECLAAGWSFLAANAGFVTGAVFLTWTTNLAFVLISIVVPLLGPIAYLSLNGVIMGGFYLACLRRMRGETVPTTEVFAGFKIAFAQLLLAGLVSSLLTEFSACCFILPAIYFGVAWSFALPLVADKKLFFWSAMELSRKVVTRVWFQVLALLLIAFLPMVIFQIFNLVQTGSFFLGMYDESNHDWQQFAQNMKTHGDDIRRLTVKVTLIGQAVLLVNFFYIGGVLMRAYENLFGPRKS